MKATGEFEVSLVPQEDAGGDATLGRMTIDKIFRGDLTAKSKGQMLTAMTAVEGSAAYVAVERVTITGTAEQVAERVAGLAALGITEVAYQPMGDVPRELRTFAAATMAGAASGT